MNARFRIFTALLSLTCSCTEMDGGGVAPTYTTSLAVAVPGQVLSVEASLSSFIVGETYVLTWKNGVEPSFLSDGEAITPTLLALLTPELTPGSYTIDFIANHGGGQCTLDVKASPVIGDPAAYVANYQQEFEALLQSLVLAATAQTDPTVQANRLADINEITSRYQEFSLAVPTASASDLAELAVILNANPLPHPAASKLDSDPISLLAAAGLGILTGIAYIFTGIVLVKRSYQGLAISGVAALGLLASGMLFFVSGCDLLLESFKIKFTPAIPLVVRQILSSSDEPFAGGFSLASDIPVPLGATGELASLSIVDRQSPVASVRELCASVDSVHASIGQLTAQILDLLDSRPPELPTNASTSPADLDPSHLEILTHDNPEIGLLLKDGDLLAWTSVGPPLSTIAVIAFSVGEFEPITTNVLIEVRNECDPTVPFVAIAAPAAAFGAHHLIDFEGESEPTGVPLSNMRLGSDLEGAFHVDLQCFSFSQPGFWIIPTSPCFAISPPTVGETIYDVNRVVLHPSAPLRSFGGYFADAANFGLGSSWSITAYDCNGRSWTAPLVEPPCDCVSNPGCSLESRWNGYVFSQPVSRIELRITNAGTYRFLVMDDLLCEEWYQ